MDWQDRLPEGVSDVQETDDGFTGAVSLPVDDDGYFGRACPECETPFKMRADEYKALPDDLVLTCPYCGHRSEHSDFMTSAQREREQAALEALAEQYMHQTFHEMLDGVFGSGRRRSPRRHSSGLGLSVEMTYTPGTTPPIRALPEVIEQRVRRTIACPNCSSHYAVYGGSAFCPVCGPRAAADNVLDAIAAARTSLQIEDTLPAEQREEMRAAGVFERFAVDAIKSTVSLFEVFARDQFRERVADADAVTKGKGNIFQRLDDTADLFAAHAGLDLVALAGEQRRADLKVAFARRHVLVHRDGIVDERFLAQVPSGGLRVGQRLVVTRQQAEAALDDLQAVVTAVASAP
jgi:uncharacterized Zn finger protein (UPF0148 family)